jgi:uncharacterized repeat protein (TIGR01451 family)
MGISHQRRAVDWARRGFSYGAAAALCIGLSYATSTAAFAAAAADLAVTKSASTNPVPAGSNETYTITVTNNGPSDASSVTLSDDLPVGETLDSVMQTTGPTFSCTPSGNTFSCTIATLTANAQATFSVVVTINSGTQDGTQMTNAATVSSSTSDPNSQNNTGTATIMVGSPSTSTPEVPLPAVLPAIGLVLSAGFLVTRRRRKR